VTAVDHETQMRLLLTLATEFPESMQGFTVTWSNEHGNAGVYTHGGGARVFLNAAEQDVAKLDDARDLLRRIFADEIVAVTAYQQGHVVYTRLAPASDPAATLPTPNAWTVVTGHRYVPDIDDLVIVTWSGGVQDKG
jgi:hypothetical protein